MKRMAARCQSVNGRPIVKCFTWKVPNRKSDLMKELTVVGLVSLWSQLILACCQSEMRGGGLAAPKGVFCGRGATPFSISGRCASVQQTKMLVGLRERLEIGLGPGELLCGCLERESLRSIQEVQVCHYPVWDTVILVLVLTPQSLGLVSIRLGLGQG